MRLDTGDFLPPHIQTYESFTGQPNLLAQKSSNISLPSSDTHNHFTASSLSYGKKNFYQVSFNFKCKINILMKNYSDLY